MTKTKPKSAKKKYQFQVEVWEYDRFMGFVAAA
jgi:hypothetical protein